MATGYPVGGWSRRPYNLSWSCWAAKVQTGDKPLDTKWGTLGLAESLCTDIGRFLVAARYGTNLKSTENTIVGLDN
ncbi:hypothetical protein IE4872_PD02077 (plasmid) [Rhizobium gallicum]|uniref:Uncharacterized protein n=1 Tax=Rhizobium gallicum TaxID=56730 RepID=A0A1L5NXH3_9HYPH|nr:hypothetical protein IE4872_PD02077 [Rhizobium gallicum]